MVQPSDHRLVTEAALSARLTDGVAPTGGAGGFLGGTYPNPGVNETALDNAVAGRVNDPTSIVGAAVRSLISSAIQTLVGAAPEQLNTIDEISAALGDNASIAADLISLIGTKLTLPAGGIDGQVLGLVDGVLTWVDAGTAPTVVGGIAIDTDGVPYFSSTGTYGLKLDTDGVPYLSATGFTRRVLLDTDNTPYHLAA